MARVLCVPGIGQQEADLTAVQTGGAIAAGLSYVDQK